MGASVVWNGKKGKKGGSCPARKTDSGVGAGLADALGAAKVRQEERGGDGLEAVPPGRRPLLREVEDEQRVRPRAPVVHG